MKSYDAETWNAAMAYVADWLDELFDDMGEDAAELFLKPGRDNVYDLIRSLKPDAAVEGVSDARIPRPD